MKPTLDSILKIVEQPAIVAPFIGVVLPLSGADMIFSVGVALMGGAVGTSLSLRKRSPRPQLLQGVVSVFAGVLCLVSLWLPWLVVGSSHVNGIDSGPLLFQITNIPIIQTVVYFLLLLVLLLILGGFLHIGGFVAGESLVSNASKILTAFSVLFLAALSFIPSVIMEVSGWIMVFGAILGIISLRLHR